MDHKMINYIKKMKEKCCADCGDIDGTYCRILCQDASDTDTDIYTECIPGCPKDQPIIKMY